MEKIKLTGVPETLFIPFYARIYGSVHKKKKFFDEVALEAYERLDYDFSKFKNAKMSLYGCLARTLIIDREFKKLVEENPNATCISIGCGFDTRFERLDNGRITWYGLDFPEVIELRNQIFPKRERTHYISKSVFDKSWVEEIKGEKENAIIILEGILMYFEEEEIVKLFDFLAENFPHATILTEFMHPYAVKTQKYHDSIKKTSAVFKWGVKNSEDIEKICPRVKFIQEWNLTKKMLYLSPLHVGIFSPILSRINNRVIKLKIF